MKQWHERKKYKDYNWFAIDKLGEAYVYIGKPKFYFDLGIWCAGEIWRRTRKYDTDGSNCENSLEERPPERANHKAMDSSGGWYWYEGKPDIGTIGWHADHYEPHVFSNWRTTLEERPK